MSEDVRQAAFIPRPPDRVLFLCQHNSSRSQIAEGFARRMAPEGVQVYSAGAQPRGVHPRAAEVMEESGLDIRSQSSKSIDDVQWREVDTLVTLCGESEEACPDVPAGVRRVHWHLPDPTIVPDAEQLAAFREVRDEIRWRVASLWPGGE